MARVVITAQVEDAREWEDSFRTHADIFRTQAVEGSMSYAVTADNEAVVSAETYDLDTFMKILESDVTINAMQKDGVKRDTVKVYVLDKTLEL